MRIKKILSLLLVICMLMGLFPMASINVHAAENEEKTGDLFLDKTAVLEEDGSYTIKLESYATGTPVRTQVKTGKALQIVIAVDQSGSMEKYGYLDKVKVAVEEFVEIVAANGRNFNVEHKIAIVGFASDVDDGPSTSVSGSTIAGGSSEEWVNTGIFDSKGEFKNYDSDISYEQYNGVPSIDEKYYIKSGSSYYQLTYAGIDYVQANNVSENRMDLYSYVNGEYKPISYESDIYIETEPIDISQTYYLDDEKTPIHSIEVDERTKETVSSINNAKGQKYYIDVSGERVEIEYVDSNFDISSFGWLYNWQGSDGNTYTNYSSLFGSRETFFRLKGDNNTKYIPYNLTGVLYYIWSADGTTEIDLTEHIVYKKGGWCYLDDSGSNQYVEEPFYELLDKWVYTNDSGEMITRTDEVVYTKLGGPLDEDDYRDALVSITDGQNGQGKIRESVITSIDNLSSSGGTRTSYGMEMAKHVFEYNHNDEDDEHGHVVIVFTDGAPGESGFATTEANAALSNAEVLKSAYDAEVYTVGLYNKENITQNAGSVNEFMNRLSSNYEGVTTMSQSATAVADKYYQTTEYVSELNSIFTNITVDSTTTSTTVALDDTAIMRDILGTGMELMPGSTITAMKVPGSKASDSADIVWNTNNAELLGSLTIDKDKPISEFVNDANSNIKLYNLSAQTMGDSGEEHPHTIDVSGFDYCGDFIAVGKDGYKLVVEITGVEASPYAVWNQAMYTNNDYSGIWTPQTDTTDRELKASFVQPTTVLTSTNYVVDYAKPFEVDLANDLGMNTVYHLDADDTNRFDSTNPVRSVQGTYGKATIEGNKLTYTPMTMNWEYEDGNPNKRGYETIYAFGNTTNDHILANSANAAEGHLWSRFNVIPANNIYYEDDFLTTSTDGTTQTGTVGIEYSGVWYNDGTTNGNTANENGGTHGWIQDLSTENRYSDGSAHVSSTPGARATFTFTGTGVDVYSRTDKATGLVIGMLYKGSGIKDENGKNKVAEQMIWMDTLSESSGEGAYYQIPTMSFCNLEYGTYTVMLTVAKDLIKDDDERMTYYLDGIRVYNPLKNRENFDSTITEAYGKEEINASFKEVRDCLLTTGSYGTDEVSGAVFIDKFGDKTGYTESQLIEDFETFGPKNEVYLGNGQLIAFVVSYDEGAQYYVGMKSISGNAVSATRQYQGRSTEIQINHTTDLYYEVTPDWKDTNNDGVYDKGIISIANTGGAGILGLSKLKITNPMPEAAEIAMFSRMSRSALVSYASTLDMNVPIQEEPEEDVEDSEEEQEKVEIEDSKEEQEKVEIEDSKEEQEKVEIEDSEEEQGKEENVDPQEMPIENLSGISKKLFADMYGWF